MCQLHQASFFSLRGPFSYFFLKFHALKDFPPRGPSFLTYPKFFALFFFTSCLSSSSKFPPLDFKNPPTLESLQKNSPFLQEDQPRLYLPTQEPQGIWLVFHGLNNKPRIMNELCEYYQSLGFIVLRGTLSGHTGNEKDFEKITSQDWIHDIHQLYQIALQMNPKNLPLYFTGFSLGGLSGSLYSSLYESQYQKPPFHKMILFAPALKTRWYSRISNAMKIFPTWIISSKSPPPYRAQRGTPGAGYQALFELIDTHENYSLSQSPTLIFVDPKDNLVSSSKLQKLIKNKPHWKLIEITTDGGKTTPTWHHLIIDSQVVSSQTWKKIQNDIENFLEEKSLKITPH